MRATQTPSAQSQNMINLLKRQLSKEREKRLSLVKQLTQNKESQAIKAELNKQVQREIQAQKDLQCQIQSTAAVTSFPSSSQSASSASYVVGDLASSMGDLASASVGALGSLTSSGVSALGDAAATGVSYLVVHPLKSASNLIRSSFTPSVSTIKPVKFSDVFPE